jgi:cytochrome c biogenesis protein CcmG/thiol:disulfide interchange protein DsbE
MMKPPVRPRRGGTRPKSGDSGAIVPAAGATTTATAGGSDSGRRRSGLVILPLLVFLGLAAVFGAELISGGDDALPSVLINRPAPPTDLPPLDGLVAAGEPVPGFSSADFAGEVSLVNVFGSWCAACVDEHPTLMALAGNERFQILGLNYDDVPSSALAWLNRYGNPFDAVGVDHTNRTAIDWGVYGAPETFIVDREGIVRYKVVGPLLGGALDRFIAELETVLAEG